MTDSKRKFQCPLVGMHFRPPARQIFAKLPLGTRLELQREPDNAYDPAAVQVWVELAEVPEEAWGEPEWLEELERAGAEPEQLRAQPRLQLGYLAASAKFVEPGQVANGAVAEMLDRGEEVLASLMTSLSGKPSVLVVGAQKAK